MALNMMFLQSWLPFLSLVFVLFHSSSIPTCHCQTSSSPQNQNIETFYPNETSPPTPTKQPPEPSPKPPPPPTQGQAPGPVAESGSGSLNGKIATAVAATAASTLVICGLIFILVQRCLRARRRKENNNTASSGGGDRDNWHAVVPKGNVFERIEGNVKGLIVDEDGLDVIYWRKLEGKNNSNKDLHKEVVLHSSPKNKEVEEDSHEGNQGSIQEIPLLRGKSSTSHINIEDDHEPYRISRIPPLPSNGVAIKGVLQKPDSPSQPSTPPPPISPTTPSSSTSFSATPKMNSPSPPPPPPMPEKKSPAVLPPAPPPIPPRKSPAAPPPPPLKTSSLKSSSKPPPGPIEMSAISQSKQGNNSSGKGMPESSNDQVKLKPLHWDKVNTNNADHSMVWDKVDRGSFR